MQTVLAAPADAASVTRTVKAPLLVHDRDEAEDKRFRKLLPSTAWAALPEPVQARFSKRVRDGATIVYKGTVTSVQYSAAGWVLAQLLRIAGAPLPLCREQGLETVVTVTEDRRCGGQFWTRMFARGQGFPQMIHSVKRFAGPTGLEEALPFGIVMSLHLCVEQQTLCFKSAGYALAARGWRLRLPAFLTPGALIVTHTGLGEHSFLFTLTLTHPWLGTLLHQEAVYAEEGAS